MNNKLFMYSLVMLFGTFISSISQVMLKKAAQKKYDSPIKEYLNPLVIGAYSIFVLATFCTVFAYRVVPLSMGSVLESSSYLYICAFGALIFKEKLTFRKVLSLMLIVGGIIIFSVLG